ncbi:acyltransferase family protein [Occallatibacter savannae]|uniref:acyltransferase family protein n=1 Tax=Occallatibacter savannae TaxID=1002691 RepID=UPI000D68A8F6|nr:acyltransferase [Occallatibacter savannae]
MQENPRSIFLRIQSYARGVFSSQLRLDTLDKKDTTILKALAIVAIVFHNFFHIAVNVRENEFDFKPERFGVFLRTVVHPSLTIQSLFAFYGHYGVQIFIFLSAYGLAKTHWDDPSSWHSFMWSRVKKLYPMFLLVIAFWAALAAIHVGALWVIRDAAPHLILMLAGVSTIAPRIGLPPVGPWWFIPFIMQAYALFPALRRLTQRFGWPSLVVLSFACYYVTHLANPILAHWTINLSMTPIGRMRMLCLGIIAARYPFRIRYYMALPAFAVLILGGKYFAFAHFSSLAAVIASLWLYSKFRPLLRQSHTLEKIGTYSLGIFLVNGIVRVPFIYFAHTADLQLTLAVASAAVTVAISSFFHYLLTPAFKTEKATSQHALWVPEAAGSSSE